VDADAETRALYRESLAGAGCEVVEASDGRDALAKALMHPPTLIITEIILPFIDGYELCQVLRRDRTTADVPILVVTTEARPAQIGRARKAGADVVMVKPTLFENILSEISRLVADSKNKGRRTTATSADAATRCDESDTRPDRSEQKRILSRSYSRMTTRTPPASPPELRCPACDRYLKYERSEIGGVSERHPEQWDYYQCDSCGTFQYRQRVRGLRRLS
jgi:two-component system chemotaxis response regulator CheY